MKKLYVFCFLSLGLGISATIHIIDTKSVFMVFGAILFYLSFLYFLARILFYHSTPIAHAQPTNLNMNPVIILQGVAVVP
jgi:hypothetical protein